MREYNLKDYTNYIIVSLLALLLAVELCLLCFLVLSSELKVTILTDTKHTHQLQQDAINQATSVTSDKVQDTETTTITNVAQTPSGSESEDEKRAKEYAANNPGETLALVGP